MLRFLGKSKEAALAPLVELAMSKAGYDRVHFLTELRRDAPTVAALVEERLGEHNPLQTANTGYVRQEAPLNAADLERTVSESEADLLLATIRN